MPIEIRDVLDGTGVVITGSGYLAERELVDALGTHLTQDAAKFRKYRYSLCDWTGASATDVSTRELSRIADLCVQAAEVNSEIIAAEVAERDLIFGLARMTDSLRSAAGWEGRVFRDRAEAEAWVRERVKARFDIDAVFD